MVLFWNRNNCFWQSEITCHIYVRCILAAGTSQVAFQAQEAFLGSQDDRLRSNIRLGLLEGRFHHRVEPTLPEEHEPQGGF